LGDAAARVDQVFDVVLHPTVLDAPFQRHHAIAYLHGDVAGIDVRVFRHAFAQDFVQALVAARVAPWSAAPVVLALRHLFEARTPGTAIAGTALVIAATASVRTVAVVLATAAVSGPAAHARARISVV